MDEKTLTALQGSIKKWEAIVAGTGYDDGADNCSLCILFIDNGAPEPEWAQDGCLGCPVALAVGTNGCSKTPYTKWSGYQSGNGRFNGNTRIVFDERSKELAQSELDFLRSLLPSAAGDAEESK